MEKPAGQNIQDALLNTARRDKYKVTINFLHGGDKLNGRIKSFDKFSILLDVNGKDFLIFKHAISTVTVERRNPPYQQR
jgi:host factor-I protein